jgi:hypothetical protein
MHGLEAVVAVRCDALPRKEYLPLRYFIIAGAAYLKSHPSNINQMTTAHSDSTERLPSDLNHLSFQTEYDRIMTFLALQFYVYLEIAVVGDVEDVHNLLLADTLKVNQQLLN